MPQRLAEANREQELAAETLRAEQRRELQVQQALREEVKPMAVDTRIYVVGLGEGTYEGYEDGLVELGPRSRQPKHRIKFDMAGPAGVGRTQLVKLGGRGHGHRDWVVVAAGPKRWDPAAAVAAARQQWRWVLAAAGAATAATLARAVAIETR